MTVRYQHTPTGAVRHYGTFIARLDNSDDWELLEFDAPPAPTLNLEQPRHLAAGELDLEDS